jgi:ElaB/YqjD/DUF883 family membrane-anchored ribosome-binding protein
MTTDKMMTDLRTVVTDAEDLLKATAGQTGEGIDKVRARAEESLRAAQASLLAMGNRLHEQVRERPWTAIGVAAALGLVLGAVLSRR